MKNIKLKAFLLKLKLRGDTSFEGLKKYAHAKGYRILFANTTSPAEEFEEYSLPQCDTAYTYVAGQIKLIVINADLSAEDIRLHLLHEIAHIELCHLDRELLNSAAAEIEADALAYYVLKSFLFAGAVKICILLMTVLIALNFLGQHQKDINTANIQTTVNAESEEPEPIQAEPETNQNIVPADTIQEEIKAETYVYVTPTGKKYHTSECRYVNPNTAIELALDTAQKSYTPCSVCKP